MNEDINRDQQDSMINNDTGRPKWQNAGTGVQRLEMSFGGKEYASVTSQQNVTHEKGIQFMMKGVASNKEIEAIDN